MAKTKRINWKVEIRRLMKDFGFKKVQIEGVIHSTETDCKGTSIEKYNYAWRKFWALLG